MTTYILETVVNGKSSKMTLDAIPVSYVVRLYSVDDPQPVLLIEKVVK